jgi:hypothetical protein
MSYAVAQPPPAKRRPTPVGVASALLYLCAALLLVSAAVGFVPYSDIRQVVIDFYANDPSRQQAAATGATIGIIITGIVYLLIAVGFVVLGSLVGKGKQPARIVTWVVAGLGVLCLGCGVAGSAISSSLEGMAGAGGESQELLDRIAAATPGWVQSVNLTIDIIALLVMVTIIILLALPASNDFFRKEQEVWVPPTDWNQGGGYPAGGYTAGGYPAGGGYPQVPPPSVPPAPPAAPPYPPTYPPTDQQH